MGFSYESLRHALNTWRSSPSQAESRRLSKSRELLSGRRPRHDSFVEEESQDPGYLDLDTPCQCQRRRRMASDTATISAPTTEDPWNTNNEGTMVNTDKQPPTSTAADSGPMDINASAPLFTLPIELLQEISTYLSPGECCAFLLSSRYLHYVVGTLPLHNMLKSATSKIDRRQKLEVIESAFKGFWYCCWCEQFHQEDGVRPRDWVRRKKTWRLDKKEYTWTGARVTAEPGYLHDGLHLAQSASPINKSVAKIPIGRKKADDGERAYVLGFHHIRQAMNNSLWGSGHGIPLSDLSHTRTGSIYLKNPHDISVPCSTTLHIEARIVDAHVLLFSSFSVHIPWITKPSTCAFMNDGSDSIRRIPIPSSVTRTRETVTVIWRALPYIIAGHRADPHGHPGLDAAIESTLMNPWSMPAQLCSRCATDYTVEVVERGWATLGHVPVYQAFHTPTPPHSPVTDFVSPLPEIPSTSFFPPPALPVFRPEAGAAAQESTTLLISTYRDLGSGRNPFSSRWRAHCVNGDGAAREKFCGDKVGVMRLEPGMIKNSYLCGVKMGRRGTWGDE